MRLRRQIDRGSARDYRLGLTLITGSAVAWSTAGFFTRLIPLDVSTMLAWRGLFGAAGIAAAILATERRDAWRSVRAMSWVSWLFAIISAAAMILFLTSLRHTTVAHAAVIYATIPFLAAALSWLVMRERPTQSATLASIAALLGVALMVGFGVEGGGLGDVLAFAMTFCVACMMVITRRFPDIPVMPGFP
jgi:drug/metabolite transporter (DMT)-like permease